MGIMNFLLNNLFDIIFFICFCIFFLVYFFCISLKHFAIGKERKKEIDNLRSILKYIIHDGVHVSILETDFVEPCGKSVSNQITRNTNVFFFLIFSSMFFPFVVKINFLTPLYSIIGISLFVFLIHLFSFRTISKNLNNNIKYFYQQLTQQPKKQDFMFKLFIRSIYITPFTFRHVWWFVLIFGFVNVQYETLKLYGTLYIFDFSSKEISDFLQEFLQLLIISTIAYIATNILRELQALREGYRNVAGKIENLTTMIPKIEEAIVKADTALGASAYGSGILKFLESLKEHSKEANEFLRVSSNVTENIQNEIAHELLDPTVQLALLSAKTNLLYNQLNRNIILTPWSNLGRISRFLMKDIKEMLDRDNENIENIEIYALQLKTPLQFLEKYAPDDPATKEDKEWIEFINENILDKDKITLKRYFAAINGTSDLKDDYDSIEREREKPQEYFSLIWEKDVMNDKGKPLPLRAKDKAIAVKDGLGNRYYVYDDETIEKELNDDITSAVIQRAKGGEAVLNEKTVSDILGTTIHKEKSCFIRIFADNGNTKDEYHSLLLDEKFHKLIDYLAIRKRNKDNGKMEWIFCVRSLYDADFDTAKIEFLHEMANGWGDYKDKLEKIFIDEESAPKNKLEELPLKNSKQTDKN